MLGSRTVVVINKSMRPENKGMWAVIKGSIDGKQTGVNVCAAPDGFECFVTTRGATCA